MKNEDESRAHARRALHVSAPTINVTPLVDVLLVLLIIFFVIQPQREAKFESQIPQKPPDDVIDSLPSSDLLMVDIKSGIGLDTVVELNSKPMSLIELSATLRGLLEQRAVKTVFIKASRDRHYGDVVRVIDTIKGAGAAPIGLQTDYLL